MNIAALIARDAIAEISSERLHRQWAQRAQLADGGRHYAILLGKTARSALRGLTSGATRYREIVGIDDRTGPPGGTSAGKLTWIRGDHPIPKSGSANAAQVLVERIDSWRLSPDDTVVVSVGGGTSSMIAEARAPLTQGGLGAISSALLASGLDVTRVNSLRGQLTTLHNGGLGARLRPARIVTLLISDNAQQRPDAVGSGPTAPTKTAPDRRALSIVPAELRRDVAEVLGHDIARSRSDSFTELASLSTLSRALERNARGRVDHVRSINVLNSAWQTAASDLWELALSALAGPGSSAAATAAGEITVSVSAGGTGGRCQQLAVAIAAHAPRDPDLEFEFAAIGTDGRDYVDGVHGAVADDAMLEAIGRRSLLESLAATDTFPVLERWGRLLTGPRTDDNLCDAYVLVVRRRS